jgi:hypothetical protein
MPRRAWRVTLRGMRRSLKTRVTTRVLKRSLQHPELAIRVLPFAAGAGVQLLRRRLPLGVLPSPVLLARGLLRRELVSAMAEYEAAQRSIRRRRLRRSLVVTAVVAAAAGGSLLRSSN